MSPLKFENSKILNEKIVINHISIETFLTQRSLSVLALGDIHIWSVSLNLKDDLQQRCYEYLTPKEQAHLSFFKFEKARRNYLLRKGLLRRILSQYLDIPPKILQIGQHEKGKPYSIDDPNLSFNCSSSGLRFVCALTRGGDLGIDIESDCELEDLDQLISKNCSEREMKYIERDFRKRRALFLQFWTFKESYLKATGEGLCLMPKNIEFSLNNGVIRLEGLNGFCDQKDWYFQALSIADASICTLTHRPNKTTLSSFYLD